MLCSCSFLLLSGSCSLVAMSSLPRSCQQVGRTCAEQGAHNTSQKAYHKLISCVDNDTLETQVSSQPAVQFNTVSCCCGKFIPAAFLQDHAPELQASQRPCVRQSQGARGGPDSALFFCTICVRVALVLCEPLQVVALTKKVC